MWENRQDVVSVDDAEIESLAFPVVKTLNSFWMEIFPSQKIS